MPDPSAHSAFDAQALAAFRQLVLQQGRLLFRDLPWRRTTDPYQIWISEVMLQQTQVQRVDGRWQRWLERFPTVDALAMAQVADVLDEWQGMGYNRRALALLNAARAVSDAGGVMPHELRELVALPGIGPATAAGIRAFAFNLPQVPDRELIPLVEATCPQDACDPNDDPRTWYYALLDYGYHLKRTVPNPSRRSRTHVRQSRFEGSHRQKRAMVVRALLAHRDGASAETLAQEVAAEERLAGREPVGEAYVLELLQELAAEGFCRNENGIWHP